MVEDEITGDTMPLDMFIRRRIALNTIEAFLAQHFQTPCAAIVFAMVLISINQGTR